MDKLFRQDLLWNFTTNDIAIKNNDFVIGNSDAQHVQDILEAVQGDYKQAPLVGIGIEQYVLSPYVNQTLNSEIRTQLEAQNYIVKHLDLKDLSKVKIDFKLRIL